MIEVSVEQVKAAKLTLTYNLSNQEGSLVSQGRSTHSFLSKDGKFLSLKNDLPDVYEVLRTQLR